MNTPTLPPAEQRYDLIRSAAKACGFSMTPLQEYGVDVWLVTELLNSRRPSPLRFVERVRGEYGKGGAGQ